MERRWKRRNRDLAVGLTGLLAAFGAVALVKKFSSKPQSVEPSPETDLDATPETRPGALQPKFASTDHTGAEASRTVTPAAEQVGSKTKKDF